MYIINLFSLSLVALSTLTTSIPLFPNSVDRRAILTFEGCTDDQTAQLNSLFAEMSADIPSIVQDAQDGIEGSGSKYGFYYFFQPETHPTTLFTSVRRALLFVSANGEPMPAGSSGLLTNPSDTIKCLNSDGPFADKYKAWNASESTYQMVNFAPPPTNGLYADFEPESTVWIYPDFWMGSGMQDALPARVPTNDLCASAASHSWHDEGLVATQYGALMRALIASVATGVLPDRPRAGGYQAVTESGNGGGPTAQQFAFFASSVKAKCTNLHR